MARITIEDVLKKVNNRFILSIMASKRAKQLKKGSKPLIDVEENREVVTALREIAAGKVTIKENNEEKVTIKDSNDKI
jgi:DNA-directed RNA polymerase subunit omega